MSTHTLGKNKKATVKKKYFLRTIFYERATKLKKVKVHQQRSVVSTLSLELDWMKIASKIDNKKQKNPIHTTKHPFNMREDDSDILDDKHDGLEEDNKSTKRLETSKANASEPVRDEKRMEINRIRAKEIRKRKKEMEEDMHNQIIQLTLENNKLRTQLQLQEAEIKLLRNNMVGCLTLKFLRVHRIR